MEGLTYTYDPDLYLAMGKIPRHTIIHKFGRNASVGTSWTVVSSSGFFRTPTTPVTLEAVSTSVNDTDGGSGARSVTIEYLDTNFDIQTGTFTMAGTSASTTIAGVMRVNRAYVSHLSSGTYATQAAGSHAGTITIRESGGGQTWVSINLDNSFPMGQSLVCAYTVPANYIAYTRAFNYSVDSGKSTTIGFFKRDNADVVSGGAYEPMRIQNIYPGVTGTGSIIHSTYEAYGPKTDIGFMAYGPSTPNVTVEIELNLVRDVQA